MTSASFHLAGNAMVSSKVVGLVGIVVKFNDILCPSNSEVYGKEPRDNET